MQQHRIKNNDTELFTLVSGSDKEETIILLHGGPAVPEDLTPIMDFLSQKFQVVYFHQRGTGKSPCPSGDFSMEAYISDLDCVAAYFQLQKFHLFGHSWGGLYAGIYAERRDKKILSLFLSSPASGTGKQWAKMSMEVRNFQKQKSTKMEWLGMLANSFLGMLGSRKLLIKFYKQFAVNCNKGHDVEKTAPLILDLLGRKAAKDTNKGILKYGDFEKLKNFYFKISITYGDDDIYGSSMNYVKERYPTAKITTIPNCGHMQWLHNGEFFYEILWQHYEMSNAQ